MTAAARLTRGGRLAHRWRDCVGAGPSGPSPGPDLHRQRVPDHLSGLL